MEKKTAILVGLVLILVGSSVSTFDYKLRNNSSMEKSATLAQMVYHDPIIIMNNSDFLTQKVANGWPGTGEWDSPILISDYIIEFSHEAITIMNVDLYFYIGNCQTLDYFFPYWGSTGIKLVNCSNGVIQMSVADMKDTGILIQNCTSIEVNSTTVHDCFTGIKILDSKNIEILENNLGWNDWVGVNSTMNDLCVIAHNSILEVPDYAIISLYDNQTYIEGNTITSTYLGDPQFSNIGVYTLASNDTELVSNYIANCESGIEMIMANNPRISDCTVSNTIEYGIYLGEGSSGATIEENYLGPTEGSNAYDSGDGNSWDNPVSLIGNYWSDYEGSGWYYIPGSAGSIDHYPMIYTPPTITTTTTTGSTTTTTPTTSPTIIGDPFSNTLIASIIIGGSGLIMVVAVILIIRDRRGLAGLG
ncbi:MAG: NosD domain-containing protein [Candidatus Thorarchaeota archaeon]